MLFKETCKFRFVIHNDALVTGYKEIVKNKWQCMALNHATESKNAAGEKKMKSVLSTSLVRL